MSEPTYTAKTWAITDGKWSWQTFKNGEPIGRNNVGVSLARLVGVASREAAVKQSRLDMEFDRDCGVEEVVLNPEVIRESKAETATTGPTLRAPGLYVVTTSPPGPNSEFVELEDQDGRGVGPLQSGAEWRKEGDYWTFGPLAPIRDGCVVIYPRKGVSPLRVHAWLVANFQQPCEEDVHAVTHDRSVIDGNPLVNAHIEVEEP